MKDYTIEQRDYCNTWWITGNKPNRKGETIIIEISETHGSIDDKKFLGRMWYDAKFISHPMESYLNCRTYVTDTEGKGFERYNPTVKTEKTKTGFISVINFDWKFEVTEENKFKIIDEVFRLFNAATGKTATEKKIENIYAIAKKRGLEVVKEIPDGWKKVNYATAPIGTTFITNGKSFLSGERKEALLLI